MGYHFWEYKVKDKLYKIKSIEKHGGTSEKIKTIRKINNPALNIFDFSTFRAGLLKWRAIW